MNELFGECGLWEKGAQGVSSEPAAITEGDSVSLHESLCLMSPSTVSQPLSLSSWSSSLEHTHGQIPPNKQKPLCHPRS